jgi:hypothetical protein
MFNECELEEGTRRTITWLLCVYTQRDSVYFIHITFIRLKLPIITIRCRIVEAAAAALREES